MAKSSPASSTEDTGSDARLDVQAMKDRLILATLPDVPFDGWSPAALRHGATAAGMDPEAVETLFPGGALEAVIHFSDLADRMMLADMEEAEAALDSDLRLHERVRMAVKLRLARWNADKEAVRRAVSILVMPSAGVKSVKCTYRTVDAIWYAAGDRSMDISFYTKRAQLGGIFTATVFYWLDDKSEGSADSWAFLDRRLGDVMRFHKARQKATDSLGRLPNPFKGLSQLRQRANSFRMGQSMRMR